MPLFSDRFLDSEFIQSISWTLIHSLWQGMVLAAIAGLIIFFTKRSKATVRYNLLVIALLLFVFTVIATYYIQNTQAKGIIATTLPQMDEVSSSAVSEFLIINNESSFSTRVISLLDANSGWIVMVWLLIICFKCIQLTAGLYGVFRLKTTQVFSPGEYWSNRIDELSKQLGLQDKVILLQSGIAKVPAVVGFFKPLILFPAGLLTSLPPVEIEAILVHELAHIRRKDFVANMLQQVIDIIFFFNPAVQWVSSLIKQERENCCDDIAIDQTESKRSYIDALVSFHEFGTRQMPVLSNAFPGKKGHLMNRIKRIIYKNNQTLNAMEKKLLIVGMLVTGIFIFAFTPGDSLPAQVVGHDKPLLAGSPMVTYADAPNDTDTLPSPAKIDKDLSNRTIITTLNGNKYSITTKNDKITLLQVNGKKIPADKIANYKKQTDKILADVNDDLVENDLEEAHQTIELSEQQIEQSKIELEQAQKEIDEQMEQSKVEMENSQKEMTAAMEELEQSQKHMDEEMALTEKRISEDVTNSKKLKESSANMHMSQKEQAAIKREVEQHMKKARTEMAQNMKQAKLQMEQAQKEMVNASKQMEEAKVQLAVAKKEVEESKKIQDAMISDFISENIIKDKSELKSYKLNKQELIVNGVKQGSAVHQRFKTKYVKGNNWTMQYNND